MSHRRTFAPALRACTLSEASALRPPGCAGRPRRLLGHGQLLLALAWTARRLSSAPPPAN